MSDYKLPSYQTAVEAGTTWIHRFLPINMSVALSCATMREKEVEPLLKEWHEALYFNLTDEEIGRNVKVFTKFLITLRNRYNVLFVSGSTGHEKDKKTIDKWQTDTGFHFINLSDEEIRVLATEICWKEDIGRLFNADNGVLGFLGFVDYEICMARQEAYVCFRTLTGSWTKLGSAYNDLAQKIDQLSPKAKIAVRESLYYQFRETAEAEYLIYGYRDKRTPEQIEYDKQYPDWWMYGPFECSARYYYHANKIPWNDPEGNPINTTEANYNWLKLQELGWCPNDVDTPAKWNEFIGPYHEYCKEYMVLWNYGPHPAK